MAYKLLGFVVWQGGKWYLRRRFQGATRKLAIAGLAGAIELTGVTNRLQEGISVNYGYSGVLIAFLARGRLLGVVLAAFLFAALVVGSYALQTTGVAQPIATIIQALIIVFLLAGDAALAFRVRFGRNLVTSNAAPAGARP